MGAQRCVLFEPFEYAPSLIARGEVKGLGIFTPRFAYRVEIEEADFFFHAPVRLNPSLNPQLALLQSPRTVLEVHHTLG